MGLSHVGLAKISEKFGTKVEQLGGDSLLMFLNSKGDKLKILGKQGQVLAYLRTKNGQKLALDAIQYIPQTFGGGSFNYEAALQTALNKRFERKNAQIASSPLQLFRAKERAGLTNSRMNQHKPS